MKRTLLSFTLVLAALTAFCAASRPALVAPSPAAPATQSITPKATVNLEMSKAVVGIYDATFTTPNYYILLSDDNTAEYNSQTGTIAMSTGYLLALDLYNYVSDPVELPAQNYTENSDDSSTPPGTYYTGYTGLAYYKDGKEQGVIPVFDTIEITRDGNIYEITAKAKEGNNTVIIHYKGRINMRNANEKASPYTMLEEDLLDLKLNNGGFAFYQGITDYSHNGVTQFNAYSNQFTETGGMAENGYMLVMMIAHKPITKRENLQIFPGDYTNATNFARDTWYPCREIDYVFGTDVFTIPFGSYIVKRVGSETIYGYLKTGTFTIKDNGDGTYSGTLDAETNLGYHVTATYNGSFKLDDSAATYKSTVSNLTDDVELDFSKIETGRAFHQGETGGCRSFIVDLGSPAGRDEGINNGGDLFRMEFLSPLGHSVVQPGIYTVVERRWDSNELLGGGKYEPFSLNKGYFTTGGADTGTRYAHFREGSWCVYDLHGPAEEGKVTVSTDDYKNYHFDIDIYDDAGFHIYGVYDGPIELMYDATSLEAGIDSVKTEDFEVVTEGRNILVLNAGDAPLALYSTTGQLVATGSASQVIDGSSLPAGIYLLKVNNSTIKIALR